MTEVAQQQRHSHRWRVITGGIRCDCGAQIAAYDDRALLHDRLLAALTRHAACNTTESSREGPGCYATITYCTLYDELREMLR